MGTLDRELLKLIRRIRDRIHVGIILESLLLGLGIGLAVGIILAISSRFIPIFNVYGKAAIIAAVGVMTTFVYAAFRTPSSVKAALKADALGLNERTVTALELIGVQSAFADLEKSDALARLRSFDYRKGIGIVPKKNRMLICLLLLVVLIGTGFVPNPMDKRAVELHKIKSKIAENKAQVNKIAEQVKANPKLTSEQKKEIEKKLAELNKELKAAKTEKELDKALQRTEKKLQLVEKKYARDDLKKLSDQLAKNQATKALSDLIKAGDEKKLKETVKEMADTLKKLDKNQLKQLSENMSELARQLQDNPELAQALNQLSNKIANGEMGNLSKELDQLSQSISQLMQDENFSNAMSQVQSQLQKMQAAQNNSQNQNGQAGTSAQGQGSSSQGNQAGQQGQQNGQGKGQGGSGAGKGTDKGQENQKPVGYNSSGVGKKDGSEKKLGQYENVFTPKNLGGQGETTNLNGKKGTGGNTEQQVSDSSNTQRGDSVPYNQVIGQYREQAMDSIEGSDVPPGMKDMVKDYFSSLEE